EGRNDRFEVSPAASVAPSPGVPATPVRVRLDRAGPDLERSLPDAAHGNCHLLLSLGLTIERLTAFAEVIERCRDRVVLGYRPVKAVCLQPVVLAINGTVATQHGIEARCPSAQECHIRRFTLVRRFVPNSTILLRH